jgi:hypothetical protein
VPSARPCKDCIKAGIFTERPAPHPGPRCLQHHRLEKKRVSKAAHAKRTEANFGVDGEFYWGLYEWQEGKCWICRFATGATKRLAIDHDHRCDQGHPPDKGCRKCIRALLCGRCNQQIGFWGPDALRRAIEIFEDPPAQRYLREIEDAQG